MSYLAESLRGGESEGARSRTRIGRYRQWQWNVDPQRLVQVVTAVLLENEEVAQWIGRICNFNIHEVLGMCKQIVLSPHVRADELLTTQVVGRPISRYRALKAIIAPTNEQFQGGATDAVVNILSFWSDQDWSPLLPARLLVYLRGREDDERNRKQQFPGFVAVSRVSDVFDSQLGIPSYVTTGALDNLRAAKLVETFDPSNTDVTDGRGLVRITARGRLHLDWSFEERTYLRMMAEVDPIVDVGTRRALAEARRAFLEAIHQDGNVREAEGAFVAGYVRYAVTQARLMGAATTDGDVTTVASYEEKLDDAWCRELRAVSGGAD